MTNKDKWWAWHKKNPHVWKYFERFTIQALQSGKKRLSHWLIINRIRWEVDIETKGDDFKISNNYIAYYARLFHHRYPEYGKVFTLKKMKDE